DSSNPTNGVVTASAQNDIFLDEVKDDLRVNTAISATGNVTLHTQSGSILDFRKDKVNQAAAVVGKSIDLVAMGGGIGTASDDLPTTRVPSPPPTAPAPNPTRLYASARDGVFITEVSGALVVLRASSSNGDVQLTVPDLATAGQDLTVTPRGAILTTPADA